MSSDGTVWASEFHSYQMVRLTGAAAGVAPSVIGVWPRYGPPAGGTQVTVSGAGLSGATAVMFGSTPAASVTDVDAGHVLAQAPAGTGVVDVTVVTPHGTTAVTAADAYHYGAPPPAPVITAVRPTTGSTGGGDRVTVTGSGLSGATVRFGAAPATSPSCTDTSCTVTSPPGTAGPVDVTAATAAGTSATSSGDVFTYLTPPPPPAVTGVSPARGPSSGGNTVTVTGTQLTGGTVTFGLIDVPASCTATACTATAPSGGVGVVNLHVITAGGTSATTAADRHTYVAPHRPAPRPGSR